MISPTLSLRFFMTDAGTEPVRDWLRDLSAQDRKVIGDDGAVWLAHGDAFGA